MKKIYLAGKVGGKKWDIIEGINPEKIRFLASDGEYKKDNSWNDEGGWFHGYVWTEAHNKIGEEWDAFGEDPADIAIDLIVESDMMVAYLDKEDSYGSIAEIAYASAFGKKIFVFVDMGSCETLKTIGKHGEEIWENYWGKNSKFRDAYWFVCSFPHVKTFFAGKEDMEGFLYNLGNVESPIEEMFFLESFQKLDLLSQYVEGKYRIDFVIYDKKIAIELDGHEGHKTKEQRTNDTQRERYLTSKGWKVIRFTGTEIFQNCKKCVNEVQELIKEQKK